MQSILFKSFLILISLIVTAQAAFGSSIEIVKPPIAPTPPPVMRCEKEQFFISHLLRENQQLRTQLSSVYDKVSSLAAEVNRLNAEIARLNGLLGQSNYEKLKPFIRKADCSGSSFDNTQMFANRALLIDGKQITFERILYGVDFDKQINNLRGFISLLGARNSDGFRMEEFYITSQQVRNLDGSQIYADLKMCAVTAKMFYDAPYNLVIQDFVKRISTVTTK